MRRGQINHTAPFYMLNEPADNSSNYVWLQIYATYIEPNTVVHTEIAREIAAWNHAPVGPGSLYLAFEQYGQITPAFMNAIASEIKNLVQFPDLSDEGFAQLMALSALLKYCHAVVKDM